MKKILQSLFALSLLVTSVNLYAQKVPAFFGTAAETNWFVSQAVNKKPGDYNKKPPHHTNIRNGV
jgi:hypothetical protein